MFDCFDGAFKSAKRFSPFVIPDVLHRAVSHPYATLIRRGISIPHPRHWVTLAHLAGIVRKSSPGHTVNPF